MSGKNKIVASLWLPLRTGQQGRFLGLYSENGRRIGHCFRGDRFTGIQQVRGAPHGARFRNETVGVTFEFNGLWQPVPVDDPNGCRYCDRSKRLHTCNAWADQPGVGAHSWTAPTDQQRLYRMQWRRYLSVRGRGSVMPEKVPPTLARGTALPS